MQIRQLVLLLAATVTSTASAAAAATNTKATVADNDKTLSSSQQRQLREEDQRDLQNGRIFDKFFPEDVCENEPGVYGFCDQSKFPVCEDGKELICYNRRPMRNSFYQDNRQPRYYIDYHSVFCYSSSWAGCSSCSPGRYCMSESRCIMDEIGYPCENWI